MSKWQQREEQQASGTDENKLSVSRCHQVLRKHIWNSQVYQGITNLNFDTAQCTGSFVTWGDYDFDYESDRFQMDREFSRCHRSRPRITNHPFRRLNHRLETYNPARPWTVSPRRRRRTPTAVGPVPIHHLLPNDILDLDLFHLQETLDLQSQVLRVMPL